MLGEPGIFPRDGVIVGSRQDRTARVSDLKQRLVVNHRRLRAHGARQRHPELALLSGRRVLFLLVRRTPVLYMGLGAAFLTTDEIVPFRLIAAVVAEVGELAHSSCLLEDCVLSSSCSSREQFWFG